MSWHYLTTPEFSLAFVLITCLVFYWLGWVGHRDDDWPGDA